MSLVSDSTREWVREHKLQLIGGFWAVGIGSALFMQRGSTARASVKVIHSRLYAQAATLTALLASAGVEIYDQSTRVPEPVDTASYEYRQKLKAQGAGPSG